MNDNNEVRGPKNYELELNNKTIKLTNKENSLLNTKLCNEMLSNKLLQNCETENFDIMHYKSL